MMGVLVWCQPSGMWSNASVQSGQQEKPSLPSSSVDGLQRAW